VDRPKDAQAVADALTAYLDGVQERLRQAELAEAEARARAIEEAKWRRLTLALAATVLLAMTLGGGSWLYLKSQRDARLAQVTREVNEALNRATALREQAKAATTDGAALFAQAREKVARARALAESGPADDVLRHRVQQLQAELDQEEMDRKLLLALDEACLAQAEMVPGKNGYVRVRAIPKFRKALRDYGMPPGKGGPAVVADRIRQRPDAVRTALLAALDEWLAMADAPALELVEPHRDWLRAVLKAAEPADGWKQRLREARAVKGLNRRRATLKKLAQEVDVAKLPPLALRSLAERLVVIGSTESAIRLLREAHRQYPGDFWVNHLLSVALRAQSPSQGDEAVRFLTAAVALRPHSPGAHLNLGLALYDIGKLDDAVASYRKAVELDPKYAAAHNNLGVALYGKGKVDEAIACYRQAIELDPKLAGVHSNLGAIFCDVKRDYDAAIACFRQALELDRKDARLHTNLARALAGKGKLNQAISCYRKAIELDPKLARAHTSLGIALKDRGKLDEAIACLGQAIQLDPKDAMAHNGLGAALADKGELDEAIAHFRQAIERDPKASDPHSNMGLSLLLKGKRDEAIAYLRKAVELDPKFAGAHMNLGNALIAKGRLDEGIACHRKAIELDPKDARLHASLAVALKEKGKLNQAITHFRQAIELDPKLAGTHRHLGIALKDRGKLDEAIACLRQAIELDRKDARAHTELGNALTDKGEFDEAIGCYRKATNLDPKDAEAPTNLGAILCDVKRDYDGAIACFRKAIALAPKNARVYYNLGNALKAKGKVDEAIDCYRQAIALDPKLAEAHCSLGRAFSRQGRFAEALAALKRGHELGGKQPGWRFPSAAWVRQAERMAALEAKLPALLKGQFQSTDTEERLALAEVCQAKKLHHAAARLYLDLFAGHPKLADNLQAGHRYNAACSAALAAASQGKDAGKFDDKERARLRQQALDWLHAELAIYTKLTAGGPVNARSFVQQTLKHWQKDTDLAGIRDKEAMAKLPAEEQKACTQLWADVAALLKKAEGKMK
jgi:superkiller protein 3